ncbi:hypothetical protein JZ751_010230, partial [Albula glossodonta]
AVTPRCFPWNGTELEAVIQHAYNCISFRFTVQLRDQQRKLALQGKGAVKAVPGAGKTWPTGASERDMALHEHLVLTVQCTEEGLCTSGTDNVQITDASLARATVLFTKGNGVKKGGPELQGKIFRQKKTNLTVSDCRCLFVLLPLAVCGLSQSRPYDARRGWI